MRPIYVVKLRTKNDWFESKPIQLQALRLALGWSQGEMAGYLGVYSDWKGRSSIISQWESGVYKPLKVYQAKLLQLAESFMVDYKKALWRIQHGKATARRSSWPRREPLRAGETYGTPE